jgi:hypothetical protein
VKDGLIQICFIRFEGIHLYLDFNHGSRRRSPKPSATCCEPDDLQANHYRSHFGPFANTKSPSANSFFLVAAPLMFQIGPADVPLKQRPG